MLSKVNAINFYKINCKTFLLLSLVEKKSKIQKQLDEARLIDGTCFSVLGIYKCWFTLKKHSLILTQHVFCYVLMCDHVEVML